LVSAILAATFLGTACSDDKSGTPGTSGPGPATTTGGAGGEGGEGPGSGGQAPTTSTTGGSGLAPVMCDKPASSFAGECDMLLQNCAPGSWCSYKAMGGTAVTACVPDAGGLKDTGQPCMQNGECKAGLHCLIKRCTPACCQATNEPCGTGKCEVSVNVSGTMGSFMACSFLPACSLFKGDCSPGTHCHVADYKQGLAVCDPPSDTIADEGQPCVSRNDCKDSQVCYKTGMANEGVCRFHCDTAAGGEPGKGGCPVGQACDPIPDATGFKNLGWCRPG
jgi:hypothetical protein